MTRNREISGVYVTEDQVRDAIEKRFPGISAKVPLEDVQDIANQASRMIAGGFTDCLDQVVMNWAKEKVNGHDR